MCYLYNLTKKHRGAAESTSSESARTKIIALAVVFSIMPALLLFSTRAKYDINNQVFNLKAEKEAKHMNTKILTEQSRSIRCLNILAIGGSVTFGSQGWAGKHPDAPGNRKNEAEDGGGWLYSFDAWPTVLEERLNDDFPCSGSDRHVVVNKGTNGCSAKCFIDRWPENIHTFLAITWDVIIIEPTSNSKIHELNHIRALLSSFAMMQQSGGKQSPNIILLSASFRLRSDNITDRPLEYDQLPEIEKAVSSLATELHIPYVSFPRYIFLNGMYNASNHRMYCLLAECTYWVDHVHITKTSHRMVADFALQAMMRNVTDNSTAAGIFYNEGRGLQSFDDLILNISEPVKNLLPAVPAYWLSFRTKSLPDSVADTNETSGVVCLDGFRPHNSRGRLSALYNWTLQQNESERKNATFVLELPSCNTDSFIHIEYLHSYTTHGILELMSWTGIEERSCNHPNSSDAVAVGSFNASNPESISVSNSREFRVSKSATHIQGSVYGGDLHLLSLAVYCVS